MIAAQITIEICLSPYHGVACLNLLSILRLYLSLTVTFRSLPIISQNKRCLELSSRQFVFPLSPFVGIATFSDLIFRKSLLTALVLFPFRDSGGLNIIILGCPFGCLGYL